mmetsp:Transcript_57795/g.122960  ORF Transcript_57795/g.122960 Transcript_57795/m.122960 type:complete len:189 (-) Transcript_57795:181-747(-)
MAAVASPAEFTFPAFYSLPPFFTLQPNRTVQAKQLSLWKQLTLDYCAHSRTFLLDITEIGGESIFKNSKLQRQLSADGRRLLAEKLVADGAGVWCQTDSKAGHQRLLVLWRPVAEWASSILKWAEDTGRIGSVETVFNLIEGSDTEDEIFHGIPRELMKLALQDLERKQRAAIFHSTTGSEGVKFLPG